MVPASWLASSTSVERQPSLKGKPPTAAKKRGGRLHRGASISAITQKRSDATLHHARCNRASCAALSFVMHKEQSRVTAFAEFFGSQRVTVAAARALPQPTHSEEKTMKPDELIAAVKLIAENLKSDIGEQIASIASRCDALDAQLKKKADEAGARDRGVDRSMADEDDGEASGLSGDARFAARRVAADRQSRSDSVDPAAFSALMSTVADIRKKQSQPQADLNAFADVQAKCDAVMRTHNERAEPHMAGEDLVSYKIRQHRKMQAHSPKWKGVELSIIAADSKAFEGILGEIRADAMQAGLNPVGLPEFQHRKIVKQSPGGHTITEFVGSGTIFKMLSRPVRHVSYIGVRNASAR
jgi:hypothetical protein